MGEVDINVERGEIIGANMGFIGGNEGFIGGNEGNSWLKWGEFLVEMREILGGNEGFIGLKRGFSNIDGHNMGEKNS